MSSISSFQRERSIELQQTIRLLIGTSLFFCCIYGSRIHAIIHPAPIVVKGSSVSKVLGYPTGSYRLFKRGLKGEAIAIPFQIDEVDPYSDYILPHGKKNNRTFSNRIFDKHDELVFMGNDVGPNQAPEDWKGRRPNFIYEIKFSASADNIHAYANEGAVYLGVYFRDPPPVSKVRYVSYNPNSAEVTTSEYKYRFDHNNYMVTRGIDMVSPPKNDKEKMIDQLIHSSMFYLRADLKYFLSLNLNHRDLDSQLEAYKTGPIRTIVRFNFYYSILSLKLQLGLYTELSFFSNSVTLPAVFYNPIDGTKSMNRGSGFYYGFTLERNPKTLNIKSNMPDYKPPSFFDILTPTKEAESLYWLSATTDTNTVYMQIKPSEDLRKAGSIPSLYVDEDPVDKVKARKSNDPKPLGESGVNIALYFDLTKFREGEHNLAIQLFFAGSGEQRKIENFKNLDKWQHEAVYLRKSKPLSR